MFPSHRTGALLIICAALLLLACLPTTAAADDGAELRQAGGEAQFRVIDRFPSGDQPRVDMPTVEEESPFHDAVEAVRDEDWSQALQLLRADGLQSRLADRPTKQFLAGYVALKNDEPQQALDYFDAIDGDELGALSDYRAYYSARAALELDDAHRATVAASAVADDSRLYDDALYLLGRALFSAGERADRERAVEVLELYLSRYGSRNDAPRVRLLIGEILETLDRFDDAAEAYIALRDRHPLRGETGDAEERLEELRERIDDDIARQIDAESTERTLRRYVGLYNNHRSEQVVDGLPNHLDSFGAQSNDRCQAIFKIAHSYTKMRHHSDATPWYDRVLDECAGTSFEIRALYLGGRGRWNAGDRAGALEIFERIWTDYPDHSFADDAMYFAGRIHRSEERVDEARQILQRQVETYPDGDMAKDAHWLLVRQKFDDENYDGIVDYVDGLDETGEDDLYTRGRLHYFRGRALELAGDDDEARRAYEDVARTHPMSYYALLAINRLARLAGESSDDVCDGADELCSELLPRQRGTAAVEVPDALRHDDAFERGTLLLSLGLTSHARGELSNLRNRHAGESSNLWALASLLDSTGAYPISHDIARRHIDGWMNEYPDESSWSRWEVAYPIPFADEVNHWATNRDIDAAKIYAIMREESGFNPRIESWANARGLLQLLDDTAARMARRDELNNYSFARLDDPNINVRLGSAYMEYLGEQFDDHPTLVSAGYNGGSGNVNNWLRDFGDLPLDLFVEDIPFGQTRNYAKRVTMSYWIYSYLYGDERVPRLAFELP